MMCLFAAAITLPLFHFILYTCLIMAASAPLSNAGKVFFGSLCAGTFGLGCWQTQRFFEKIDLIEKRKRDLECEPEELLEQDTTTPASNWRRKRVVGTFRHGQEILVGPRGAPLGALEQMEGCPRGGVQGMASGPQGYFVVTPMDRTDGGEGTVFVNRGWIPRHLVKDVQPSAESWERPKGNVSVECVLAKPEGA
jgi:surfeit locus 1 family protein